ncbi:MAG: ABC transporter permease, partial [Acidobacteriaceae bacterium]
PDQCELTESNPARLNCIGVEANFLPTLGVAPLMGRNFLREEDRPNGPKVALISYGLWSSHFNRNPGILNKLIQIDGKSVRVVGVLPKNFEMPTLDPLDILVPRALDETAQRKVTIGGSPMRAFARLKPGVSIAQAEAELKPLFQSTLSFAPPFARNQLFLKVRSMRDFQMHDVQTMAWILLGSVVAVLLIACANVASLLMARGAARERELAVRFVLGATRARLVRQTLTEAFLLAGAGAVVGCVLAEILLRIFVAIAPAGILFLRDARLDLRIILFTVVVSLVCALLFGLAPAAQKPRIAALAAHSKRRGADATMRRILVVGQIAGSMVLLSSAMLLVLSFWNLQEQNLGMQTRHVLTARVSLSNSYATGQKQMQFYLQAEAALRRLPGVAAVALSDSLPPGGWHNGSWFGQIAVAGRPKPMDSAGQAVVWRWVTPDYFHVLDIPIIQGHGFTEEERDSNEQFLVLSKLLANRLFPAGNAIGQRIRFGTDKTWHVVAGIAGNVKNSGLSSPAKPEYYRLRRNFAVNWDPSLYGIHSVISLETVLPPAAVAPWVRSQISKIDPTAPVEIETLNRQVSMLAARPRFETTLLAFFAFTGLIMAVIGLYGVISFLVTHRTQEIGVRMALGAQRSHILRMVLREAGLLIAIGMVIGIATALATAQLLRSLLFDVTPRDPLALLTTCAVLLLTALFAAWWPARRAASVDPMQALRSE